AVTESGRIRASEASAVLRERLSGAKERAAFLVQVFGRGSTERSEGGPRLKKWEVAGDTVHDPFITRSDRKRRHGPGGQLGPARIADDRVGYPLAFGFVREFEQGTLGIALEDDLGLAASFPFGSRPAVGVLVGRQRGVGDLRGEFSRSHPDVGPRDDGLFHAR